MKSVLEVSNLTKTYDGTSILHGVNFDVGNGEIIGLLGRNGAGKTTLLKLLSGFLEPTDGNVYILGENPWISRDIVLKNIGIMIETPVFYEHLSAYENLSIHLQYMNVNTDISSILSLVGLAHTGTKPVCKFSMGMRQKLAIARTISHKPKILLLDEPINGLDPIAIEDIRKLFLNLKQQGTTILLSSHILGELLATVEKITIISNGVVENLGMIDSLKRQYSDNLEHYLIERMRA